MIRNHNKTLTALLVAALVWMAAPAPAARADSGSSSIGAGITIGLMFAVVIVYGLVSLRSDVERYSQADTEDAIARAARMAEESPVVLHAISAPLALSPAGSDSTADFPSATLAWRIRF